MARRKTTDHKNDLQAIYGSFQSGSRCDAQIMSGLAACQFVPTASHSKVGLVSALRQTNKPMRHGETPVF